MLGIIIYFALSPRSEKWVKRAAAAALGLISLAIMVCLIMIIAGPREKETPVFTGLPSAVPVKPESGNTVYILSFGMAMLLFLGIVIFVSLRNQRRGQKLG
jgi:heme A synthase